MIFVDISLPGNMGRTLIAIILPKKNGNDDRLKNLLRKEKEGRIHWSAVVSKQGLNARY